MGFFGLAKRGGPFLFCAVYDMLSSAEKHLMECQERLNAAILALEDAKQIK